MAKADSNFQELTQLTNVLNNFPYFIFWKDIELNFRGCNQKFAAQFGFSLPEQIIGKTDFDFLWSDDLRQNYLADDQKVLSTGLAKLNYEEQQLQPDGTVKTLLVNKVPFYNRHEKIIGVLGFYTVIDRCNSQSFTLSPASSKLSLETDFSDKKTISAPEVRNISALCALIQKQQRKHIVIDNVKLSKREIECIYYTIQGYSAKEIGQKLLISNRTVESYLLNVKTKINFYSKSDLFEWAIKNNLISL